MDWKTYEEVTKNIYEALGKESGVKIIGWGNNFKVKGKSEVENQIDILTSHSDGIHTYLTDIECKYWNQNINKDTIMKVKSIVDDCLFQKGVVVSKLGFTPDAIKYAKSVNIGLVELREPNEDDWEGRIKDIIMNFNLYFPEITKYEQRVSEIYSPIDDKRILTNEYCYKYPDGTEKTVSDIIEDFTKKLSFDNYYDEIEEVIDFPTGTLLKDFNGDKVALVMSLKIAGKLIKRTHQSEIIGEDDVFMIMKSIFENKTHAIYRDGEIRDVSF